MTSADLLRSLRAHVLECGECDAAEGVFCDAVRPQAEQFTDERADEVQARAIARRMRLDG